MTRRTAMVIGIISAICALWYWVWTAFENDENRDVCAAAEILAMNAARHGRIDIIDEISKRIKTRYYVEKINAYRLVCLRETDPAEYGKLLAGGLPFDKNVLVFESLRAGIIGTGDYAKLCRLSHKAAAFPDLNSRAELYLELAKKFRDLGKFAESAECLAVVPDKAAKRGANFDSRLVFEAAKLALETEDKKTFLRYFKSAPYSKSKVLFALSLTGSNDAVSVFGKEIEGLDLRYKRTIDPMFVSDAKMMEYPVKLATTLQKRSDKFLQSLMYSVGLSMQMNLYIKKRGGFSIPALAYAFHCTGNPDRAEKYLAQAVSDEQLFEMRNGISGYAEVAAVVAARMGRADLGLAAQGKIYPKWKRAVVLRRTMRELSNDGKFLDQCLQSLIDIHDGGKVFDLGISETLKLRKQFYRPPQTKNTAKKPQTAQKR